MNPQGAYVELQKPWLPEQAFDIILYGHDHQRSYETIGNTHYINSGFLGCPGTEHNIAHGSILTLDYKFIRVESMDVVYDVEKVMSAFNRINVPSIKLIKRIFYDVND